MPFRNGITGQTFKKTFNGHTTDDYSRSQTGVEGQFIKSGILLSGEEKGRAMGLGESGRGRVVGVPLSVDWWRIDQVCLSSILRSERPTGASPPVSTAILRRRSPSVPRLGRNWTKKMRLRSSFRRRKTSQRQLTTGTEPPMAAAGGGGGEGAGRRRRRRRRRDWSLHLRTSD